jgi:hypothetical protein
MKPIDFHGVTHRFSAPAGWDAARHGPCEALPAMQSDRAFTSCWRPSFKERLALLFRPRATVVLTILTARHPPVALEVQSVARRRRRKKGAPRG